jgi:ATP-dependent Clp protease adaptor protein ClpS
LIAGLRYLSGLPLDSPGLRDQNRRVAHTAWPTFAPGNSNPGGTPPGTGSPGGDAEGDVAVEERQRTQRPRRYLVVFHNDDYTTMEFVVHVLTKFFHKSETAATQIMLHVHHKGYGVVDTFTRDVAETKAAIVMAYAQKHAQPLKCTAEPEGFGTDD